MLDQDERDRLLGNDEDAQFDRETIAAEQAAIDSEHTSALYHEDNFPVDNAKEAAEYIEAVTELAEESQLVMDESYMLYMAIAHALLAIREELRDLNIQIREANL